MATKIYQIDPKGDPWSCKIYDDTKTLIFKVFYGYRMSDGLLAEERIFNSRVKHLDPAVGTEIPSRRIIYSRNSDGTIINTEFVDAESVELPDNLLTAFYNPFTDKSKSK